MDPQADGSIHAELRAQSTQSRAREVLLSPDIWQSILEQAQDDNLAQRVAVAIAPLRKDQVIGGALDHIVAWAVEDSSSASESIAVPAEWLQRYPQLFSSTPARARLQATRLVHLGSIVLLALDARAYDFANTSPSELQEKLSGELLRHGEVIELESGPSYRVIMAEPVLQGLVSTSTRFVVAPTASEPVPSSPSAASDDDFDISEAFLASTLADAGILRRSTNAKANGDAVADQPAEAKSRTECRPLSVSVSDGELAPNPPAGEDDECRIYLRPSELAALGIFSGATIVVTASHSRIARAYSLPSSLSSTLAIAYLPPAFFASLLPDSQKGSASSHFAIEPLHLDRPLQLPTAAMVTVSRVCSSISVDRHYQPLFLNALKVHFEERQRCLRAGDLIAVPINIGQTRTQTSGKDEAETDFDRLPGSAHLAATDVVYFKITGLDVDTSALAAQNTATLEDRIARGDLGAFIDPLTTKMIQSGTCQSLVPVASAASYLGCAVEPAPPAELEPDKILGKIVAHIQALLQPEASRFDLPLSILIKSTARGSGKRTLARWAAAKTGLHLVEIDCYDVVGETDVKTEGHLRARFEKAISCAPCIFLLTHIEALARKTQAVESGQEPAMTAILQDCIASLQSAWKVGGFPTIVVATTSVADRVPVSVLASFKTEFVIEAPNEAERLVILQTLLDRDHLAPDVTLRAIAIQTAALVANDLVDLVSRTRARALQRARQAAGDQIGLSDLLAAGVALTSEDFNAALEKARASYSESIGAPKIPNVTWDDVGGLANVKSEILDTIQLPLERPELFADGLKKRSGILLYGPPGTGKTLLAKAVATSCSLNFFSVKGPELLNMYIGESEANVRRVFQRARDAKPCVIFFDELDSVAPKRGNQGDSGGVMDRIVSQLLAELDGMSDGRGGSDVFVVGATNRPDLLDPALLRPGRFDRMLYLGVSDTHDAQLRILQALTRKFRLAPDTSLAEVAELCPFNYTGADFYALCSDAMLKAMSRKAEAVEERIRQLNAQPPYSDGIVAKLTPQYYLAEMARPEDTEVLVAQQDFELALRELVPSVSQTEMEHYAMVQQRFSAKAVDEQPKVNGHAEPAPAQQTYKGKGKGKGKARA